VLNGEYDTVTMWIKTTSAVTDFKLGIFDRDNGWVYAETVTLPSNTEAMYTFKMDGTFKEIYQFGFGVHYSLRNRFYIDSIHAYKSDITVPKLPALVYTGETVTFSEVTLETDCENAEFAANVKYKWLGETEYTELTATDGKYAFAPTTAGSVEIVVEVTFGLRTETYTYTIEVMNAANDPAVDDTVWETFP
jgi:hypothetical protein